MQLAVEALCKRKLLLIAERLVSKYEHPVFVHAGPDLLECILVLRLTQVDAMHFSDKVWMKLGK
jgi:hypothetical protein